PLDRGKDSPTPTRAPGTARAGGIDAPMPPAKFGFGGGLPPPKGDAPLPRARRPVPRPNPPPAPRPAGVRPPPPPSPLSPPTAAGAGARRGARRRTPADAPAALGGLPCQGAIPDTEVIVPPYPILAQEEVRHVGDAVAFVVAQTPDQARDAAEAIAIEWEA